MVFVAVGPHTMSCSGCMEQFYSVDHLEKVMEDLAKLHNEQMELCVKLAADVAGRTIATFLERINDEEVAEVKAKPVEEEYEEDPADSCEHYYEDGVCIGCKQSQFFGGN